MTVSVIGGHECSADVEHLAHDVGENIAKVDCVLVCGGLSGVMQAAARGCREAGGLSIGILPGKDKSDANPFIDIALPTSIGYARNAMVACSADIIIALPGSHGTRSEISYGLVYKRPIIDLGGWQIEGMIQLNSQNDLEQTLRDLIKTIHAQRDGANAG